MQNLQDIYRGGLYPPMCHPSAELFSVQKIAAQKGFHGHLKSSSKILEVGCGQGHHLLSLAERYPEASLTGLDLSKESIRRARRRASEACLQNVTFEAGSFEDYSVENTYDFVIAHGIFSWVPDTGKIALMDRLRKWLAPGGLAVVSFNVAAGWKPRMAVVNKVHAVKDAANTDEMTALSVLHDALDGLEKEIVNDMLMKGPGVLAFDDFAPVMDAWSLGAFLKLAEASGLQYVGDSLTGEMGSDAEDETQKTTFRTEIFCRDDAEKLVTTELPELKNQTYLMPDMPRLSPWRKVCVREGLPIPDGDLKPCVFPFSQLKVLAAMDGRKSLPVLADYAREVSPDLDFIAWMRYVVERGFFS